MERDVGQHGAARMPCQAVGLVAAAPAARLWRAQRAVHLDRAQQRVQDAAVAVNPAAGIGVPNLLGAPRAAPNARRVFFACRLCGAPHSMAGGVREPQGSPVPRSRYANRTSSAALRLASQRRTP